MSNGFTMAAGDAILKGKKMDIVANAALNPLKQCGPLYHYSHQLCSRTVVDQALVCTSITDYIRPAASPQYRTRATVQPPPWPRGCRTSPL